MKKIIFFFDASNKIGRGHLIRCCVIAKTLIKKKYQNILIGNIDRKILGTKKNLFKKIIFHKSNDLKKKINKLIEIYKKYGCDYAVIDNQYLPDEIKKKIILNKIKWLEFLPNIKKKTFANMSVCTIPYFKKQKNAEDTRTYFGKEYAFLRDQFFKKKNKKTHHKIFVNTGGGEDKGCNLKILKKIYPILNNFKVILLLSKNQQNYKIFNWIKKNDTLKKIQVILNKENIVDLIDQSKFAICTGGTISHEIDARCKKMIIVSIVKNQVLQSEKWENFGHTYVGPVDKINNKKFFLAFRNLQEIKNERFMKRKKKFKEIIDEIL